MKLMAGVIGTIVLVGTALAAPAAPLKLLYWNIQNGMWDGQADNYERFVAWVKAQDPDICAWCEAASLYQTDTQTPLRDDERRLPAHWNELAARYGHASVAIGACRDGYPQVITSKHPIETVRKIVGTSETRQVVHGAGWFRVSAPNRTVNVVTLHAWPQKFSPHVTLAERPADIESGGGDKYRTTELQEILHETVGDTRAERGDWIMCGDFNAFSRIDNALYGLPENSTKFLPHDLIAEKTSYVDILARFCTDPNNRITKSKSGPCRIDFVYVSPSLAAAACDAKIIRDGYTRQRPAGVSTFFRPSDHLPISATFESKRLPVLNVRDLGAK